MMSFKTSQTGSFFWVLFNCDVLDISMATVGRNESKSVLSYRKLSFVFKTQDTNTELVL
jgi:hypothetical protein